MLDLGTVRPGTTIYIPFNTFDSNDPSASVTISGLATTDIEVYKDGSTTQRASDAGYSLLDTDGIDFDGTTGIHGISIDLADNTTANFYESGSQYWVVIASITVDAATVNFIAATFRIGYPDAILNTVIATLASQTSFTLEEGPADDDALNGMWAVIHDLASAVQLSMVEISDYVGSTRTVTLAAGATFTAAAGDNISIMGPMPLQPATTGRALEVESDGMAHADLKEYKGSVPANLADTDKLPASTQHMANDVLGAANIAANAITSSELADGAITAAKIATDAITADKIAANAIGASEIADGAIDAGAIAANALDGKGDWGDATVANQTTISNQVAAVDTVVDAILVDTGTTIPATLGTPAGADMSADIAAIKTVADGIASDNPNTVTKGVQLTALPFLMVDATDFATPETGLTVSGTISKDGGAFAAVTNAVSEIGNGVYAITLTASEMDADTIIVRFTATGAADRFITLVTQPT